MYKLFPLPILLMAFALNAGAAEYNVLAHTLLDTVPKVAAPQVKPPSKEGLFKKLIQFLQFRKNARAREQVRVLNIIANSGLQDSLEATVRRLNAIDSAQRTLAEEKERDDIRQVLNAIDSLKTKLAEQGGRIDSSEVDGGGLSIDGQDKSVDDQAIQDMVNRIVSLLSPAEQQNLSLIHRLLQGSRKLCDTFKINDSLSQQYTYRVRTKMALAGFYPHLAKEQDAHPDLRLINEVAWYSAGFRGRTGDLTGGRDWQTAAVLDAAEAKGSEVSLCVESRDRKNIDSLLRSHRAQQVLITDILTALDARHAAGVYILFDDPPSASSTALTSFIIDLAEALKTRSGRNYRLGIRIPAYAPDNIYDLPTLNEYVDRFLVDFTEYQMSQPGPLAPLTGVRNNDLKTCLSRYLNIPIPAGKLMVCLPYFGISWTLRSGSWTSPTLLSYRQLRASAEYQQPPTYEPASATQRLDLRNKAGVLTQRVWYDDDVSLGAKYDFLLQHEGLGGIMIVSLGDDDGYGELWDVMAAKLARVDTAIAALKMNRKKAVVLDDWQWSWAYINAKIEQYEFLFGYPCEPVFPRVLIRKWEQAGVRNNDRHMIRKEASSVIGRLSIVLALLFAGGVLLFINRIRHVGERWKWMKPLAGLLIFLFVLLTVTGFMYLFLDKSIVSFGVSDEASDCFDFPLGTLFAVVFTGIAIGALITRFLVFPLMKRDDVP
jgi:spore germination protein YaaH